MQRDLNLFYCLNTLGGEGYCIYDSCSIAAEYRNEIEVDCGRNAIAITPYNASWRSAVATLHQEMSKRSPNLNASNEIIALSPLAFSKVLYLFLVATARHFALPCLCTIEERKLRSITSPLTVVENSESNSIVSGNVDWAGHPRVEKVILAKDGLQSPINDREPPFSSGSSYRENHRYPPSVRPSKVFVPSTISSKRAQKTYGNVAVIEDLVGIEQSFSPQTLKFSATGVGFGRSVNSGTPIPFDTDVLTLFESILCVSDDYQYCLDGSIVSGTVYCKKEF